MTPDATMGSFGPASQRLVGRAFLEPQVFQSPILAQELQPAIARCGQALRRHFPAWSPADFLWRYSFVVGALHHTAATLHDVAAYTAGICLNHDGTSALRNFIPFATAALQGAEAGEKNL